MRSHLLPDQLPGEHTGDMAAMSAFLLQPLNLGKHRLLLHLIYHTSSITAIRYKYGPHVFFYVNQSRWHDSTHPSLFMSWGALWLGSFLTCNGIPITEVKLLSGPRVQRSIHSATLPRMPMVAYTDDCIRDHYNEISKVLNMSSCISSRKIYCHQITVLTSIFIFHSRIQHNMAETKKQTAWMAKNIAENTTWCEQASTNFQSSHP